MQCLLVLEADEDDHKQNGLLAVHSEEEKKRKRAESQNPKSNIAFNYDIHY